jgi:hypothetical protein
MLARKFHFNLKSEGRHDKYLNTFMMRMTCKRPLTLSYQNQCTIYQPLFILVIIYIQTLYMLQLRLPEVLWQLY